MKANQKVGNHQCGRSANKELHKSSNGFQKLGNHQGGRSAKDLHKSSNGHEMGQQCGRSAKEIHKSSNGHHNHHVCSRSPQAHLTNGVIMGRDEADQGAATGGSRVKRVEFASQLEAVGGDY